MRQWALVLACAIACPCLASAQVTRYSASTTRLIQSLVGTVVSEDDGLSIPSRILVMDGMLVVLDRGAEHVIRVYDARTGKRVSTFGRRGPGPGEFTGAWDLFRGPSPRTFFVLDVSQRRLTRLTIDSLGASSKYRGDAFVALSGEGSLESVRVLNDQGFVATGTFSAGRLAQYSSSGSFIGTSGALPGNAAGWPPIVAQDAFAARLGTNGEPGRYVVAYRWTDRIEILDSKGTLVKRLDRPLGFEPTISNGSFGRAAFNLDSRRAYLSATWENGRIYALFSGRTEREAGKLNSFGRDVLMFSADGQIRRVLRLDGDALAIGIDGQAQELYALFHDPSPRIIRYRIPPD